MITDERLTTLIGRSDGIFLDIGANDGAMSKTLARLFPQGRIVAFEPDPRAAQRFRERVDNPRVRLLEIAVGAEVGRVAFYQSGGCWPCSEAQRLAQDLPAIWDRSGSIREPKKHLEIFSYITFKQHLEVPIITLDAWNATENLKRIDFISALVQGAELDLIRGAQESLRRARYLYIGFFDVEYYQNIAKLNDITSSLPDYRLLDVIGNNALLENEALVGIP